MRHSAKIILLIIAQLYYVVGFGQATQKKTDHNTHTWAGVNSIVNLNKHWLLLADAHIRENNFFASNSFYFGRIGLGYQVNKNLYVAAGYANLLTSPSTTGWVTKSGENRIYQQVQLTSSYNKIKLLQRIRNEQRWQQIIADDKKTGKNKFTNRVRYLLSVSFLIFKNPGLPQIILSDECMLQFGKDVVYNTFDQNRLFIGIKQKINNNLFFDTGYMNVFQQKSNGSSYNKNNTFRIFFYYSLYLKKKPVSKKGT